MTNKEKYIEFYENHPEICIYSSPWWLDATAGSENWDVILIEKNDNIIATFPYVYTKKIKFIYKIGMPILTQKLGPFILYDQNIKMENRKLSYEHEIYQQIIEKLPKFDIFYAQFDQQYKNWLPFYWAGFQQTSRYSYQIYNIKNHKQVLENFNYNRKQPVKKAQKYLSLRYDLDPDSFYNYFEETIDKRNDKMQYSRDQFRKLHEAVYKHNAGRIFYCVDIQNNIHAINFTVWDKNSANYLIAIRRKEYNTSGGTEYLVYETIKYVSQFVDTFDFEGSMLKGVEASYRFYGGHQTEYYKLSKMNNKLIKFYKLLRDF